MHHQRIHDCVCILFGICIGVGVYFSAYNSGYYFGYAEATGKIGKILLSTATHYEQIIKNRDEEIRKLKGEQKED